MTVRHAIFPVAGLGTRFLPATKALPKEMLPVVDKPLIQYAVEEAYAAGVREMIFVTSRHKRAIEVILDGTLVTAGDEDHLPDPGGGGLLHGVLDQRLVDDRQHLLRARLGRREESCTAAGDREHGRSDLGHSRTCDQRNWKVGS